MDEVDPALRAADGALPRRPSLAVFATAVARLHLAVVAAPAREFALGGEHSPVAVGAGVGTVALAEVFGGGLIFLGGLGAGVEVVAGVVLEFELVVLEEAVEFELGVVDEEVENQYEGIEQLRLLPEGGGAVAAEGLDVVARFDAVAADLHLRLSVLRLVHLHRELDVPRRREHRQVEPQHVLVEQDLPAHQFPLYGLSHFVGLLDA